MPRFSTLTGTVAPLPMANVDTDQIIPASYLKVTVRDGLGEGLFSLWRKDPSFVPNHDKHKPAQILLAGDNFGCGSSREHAPWALLDYGFRAVLSTRFADIFRNNSLKNGLLVVPIPEAASAELFAAVEEDANLQVSIDLESQQVTYPSPADEGESRTIPFEIDPFARHCLLEGIDQLDYLLDQIPAIEQYEEATPARVDTLAQG